MSHTATETPTQVTEPQNAVVREAEDAIYKIERAADEIDDRMTELCDLDDLPEDVEWLADDLRSLDLTSDLNRRVTRLRNSLAAADKEVEDDEETAS